jgi:acetyltransferase-like isoleucine patch superfamily enzyme
MLKFKRIFWFARYLAYSIVGGVPSFNLVAMAPQLLVIGFSRIKFNGRALLFPLSRFEIFKGGALHIGNGVQIGQFCHITCASDIFIGDNVAVAGCAVITDISHGIGPAEIPPLKRAWSVKPVHIGKNCFIGWGAVILPGTYLSDGCVVGANVKVSGRHPVGSVIT